MIAVVINRLVRAHGARRADDVFSGVQVSIEAREVAARNVQPYPVSSLEHVPRCPQVDRVLINLAGRNERRLLRTFSIPGTHDPVRKKPRIPALIHIDKQRREIRINSGSRGEKIERNEPSDFSVFSQRRRRKHQHIRPRFIWSLIRRPGWNLLPTTKPAADRTHRILRIVIELILSLSRRWRDAQHAITRNTVRAFGRMKVVLRVARACERKLLLVSPDVLPHDEKPNRRAARI